MPEHVLSGFSERLSFPSCRKTPLPIRGPFPAPSVRDPRDLWQVFLTATPLPHHKMKTPPTKSPPPHPGMQMLRAKFPFPRSAIRTHQAGFSLSHSGIRNCLKKNSPFSPAPFRERRTNHSADALPALLTSDAYRPPPGKSASRIHGRQSAPSPPKRVPPGAIFL